MPSDISRHLHTAKSVLMKVGALLAAFLLLGTVYGTETWFGFAVGMVIVSILGGPYVVHQYRQGKADVQSNDD